MFLGGNGSEIDRNGSGRLITDPACLNNVNTLDSSLVMYSVWNSLVFGTLVLRSRAQTKMYPSCFALVMIILKPRPGQKS